MDMDVWTELFYSMKQPDTIWHYTDANGFLGIVRDNEIVLWFTRSDCLNDTSEGQELLKYYKKVCEKLLRENRISQEFYARIKDFEPVSRRLISYPKPRDGKYGVTGVSKAECETYICSFSIATDSLDMWRYYSNRGGYALGFSLTQINQIVNSSFDKYDPTQPFCSAQLEKVMYSQEEKEKFLSDNIERFYKQFSSSDEDHIKGAYCIELSLLLNDSQYLFKHACFANEKEVRLIFHRPMEKPKSLGQEIPPIKYRTQNGMIVPYIEVKSPHLNHLKSVYISPFLRNSQQVPRVEDYLQQKGFPDCKAIQSELPVRF